jgi:hypothetical protein
MSEQSVAALVSQVDGARRRLYALLRSADGRVLSKRPASGNWSIIENVRHLVFAEQIHLGKFLPDGLAWNPMRMPKGGKAFTVKGGEVVLRYRERQLVPEYAGAGANDDLEEALRAWDLVHQPIRKALKAKGEGAATAADAQYRLERHLGHLVRHVEVIEKQLARADKGA